MKNKFLLSTSLLLSFCLGGCSFLGNNNIEGEVTYSCNQPTAPLTNPATPIESEYNLAELYEYAVKGTVTVLSYDQSYSGLATGSGVIIEENVEEGYVYIITNGHVVGEYKVDSGHQTVTKKAEIFEIIYYNNHHR